MKLKDEDLKEIARLVDEGYSYTRIAPKFGIGVATMDRIIRRYKKHGLEGILHSKSKLFTVDEKLTIINRYYAGESKTSLAIEINVSHSVVQQWISKYEKLGYNGLIDNRGRPGVSKMGRPRKNQTKDVTSTNEAMAPITDAEREELNRLRKENYQLQMENECLKKLQALVQERQNRQTRKK
ncbi:MAG: helix-turn-helix domain-containing protein [Acholeplasmatales bacterium]|nr:helix-turn-helix domain-containing protein [Acholeplasmatales bacterium]